MTEGVSWCPVPAYMMKAMTDAIAGIDMATAWFPARINSIDRTWLREIVRYRMKQVRYRHYLISRFLYPPIRSRKGFSHAKNLISFMPPSNS